MKNPSIKQLASELSLEEQASHELAALSIANIEQDEILAYAIITCAIRYALRGVSREFLARTIEGLGLVDKID